jgi:hypothetical protein
VKVEILNDGPGRIEVRTLYRGVTHLYRPTEGSRVPVDIIVLAMAKEIEELREALELDASDLADAKRTLEMGKMDIDRALDEALRLLNDRGQPMTKETP